MNIALRSSELRHNIARALQLPPANSVRLRALARFAHDELGMLESIQIDKALAACSDDVADAFVSLRLAIVSTHTIDHLAAGIRVAGLRHGLRFEVHAGGFGQYRHELLSDDSPLHAFRPDLVLLSLSATQATAGIALSASADQVDGALIHSVDELRQYWRRVRDVFGATPIQQTCLDTTEPLFGSYDRLVPASPSSLVQRFNDLLAEAARAEGVLLLDLARASARDGLDSWFDTARWLQAKIEVAPQAAPRYGELVARLVAAQRGRSRKCLVLDLDNTLWGGVVGDVGTAGLVLGQGNARGEAHLALQRYAQALKSRGVILAVCSKNEASVAEAAFRDHPEMVLRPTDIAAFVANWNDKAENLRQIAARLNIGLDSLVFVDDNPVERARVREALPMVAVPELPEDPALYVRCIARGGYFEAAAFTADDLRRGDQYADNAAREAARATLSNVDDFLQGLHMELSYGPISEVDLARATQLINKTNQFNTTTRRRTAEEVQRLSADPANITLQFRLADRFGDNGLVSVMLLLPARTQAMEIDTWIMSCRVFGRELEHEALNIAVEAARERGVCTLFADFIPTERNAVIRELFPALGFNRVGDDLGPAAASRWTLDVNRFAARPTHIQRKAVPTCPTQSS